MNVANPTRSAAAPTIVLVHGAWADASSWREVIPRLQARGLPVAAAQNPLWSLTDDVATVQRGPDLELDGMRGMQSASSGFSQRRLVQMRPDASVARTSSPGRRRSTFRSWGSKLRLTVTA